MTTVRDDASLHPETVTEASRGEHVRRKHRRSTPRSSRVSTEQVDPRVWEQVQAIVAAARYTRVEVVSPTEVIVR